MRLRTFAMEDYPAAAALWRVTDGMSAPSAEEVARKLERDPQLFLVAEDPSPASDLLGVAMGTYDGRRGWIFRLAVDPGHRRLGVGRALVEELERRFEAMGVRHLRLLAMADNDSSRRFWERLGYGPFEAVVLFSKDLGAAAGLGAEENCDC